MESQGLLQIFRILSYPLELFRVVLDSFQSSCNFSGFCRIPSDSPTFSWILNYSSGLSRFFRIFPDFLRISRNLFGCSHVRSYFSDFFRILSVSLLILSDFVEFSRILWVLSDSSELSPIVSRIFSYLLRILPDSLYSLRFFGILAESLLSSRNIAKFSRILLDSFTFCWILMDPFEFSPILSKFNLTFQGPGVPFLLWVPWFLSNCLRFSRILSYFARFSRILSDSFWILHEPFGSLVFLDSYGFLFLRILSDFLWILQDSFQSSWTFVGFSRIFSDPLRILFEFFRILLDSLGSLIFSRFFQILLDYSGFSHILLDS